ncbi:MAG TPA: serine hydrolase domain-containing protein [Bacteroidales bacterium]|nr:serine hydrolase domain-containing protein [Bacteroidales bacterium]
MMKNTIIFFGVLCFIFSAGISFSQENYNVDSIEKNIDKYLQYFSGNNPGAVIAVMKKGDLVFNKAYGLSDVEQDLALKNNEAFDLVNLSKMFTALAIFQLDERNKLSLEQPITDFFPDFPAYGEKIKVKHLIHHTSGLIDFDEEKVTSQEKVLTFLQSQDTTRYNAGEKWDYSNADYPLLVLIIEVVSGKSYKEYMTKRIFKKIKTNQVFFAEDLDEYTDIAAGHIKEDEQYVVANQINMIYGEQGIFMSSEDFSKWDKALYTDRLLDCETLNSFFSRAKLDNGENIPNYYGNGLVIMKRNDERYWWHGGSGNGYTHMYLHLPNHELTILILTNRQDGYNFLKMAIYIAKEFEKEIKL